MSAGHQGGASPVNTVYTFATLPVSVAGARAFVSDANLTATGNFGNVVSGGGSNVVPVFYNGISWLIG